MNAVLVRIGTSGDRVEAVFEGEPIMVAENGAFNEARLRRLGLRPRDVDGAMRLQGATGVRDVARAELMPSGTLLVELKEDAQQATRGDVRQLMARLEDLEAAVQRRD